MGQTNRDYQVELYSNFSKIGTYEAKYHAVIAAWASEKTHVDNQILELKQYYNSLHNADAEEILQLRSQIERLLTTIEKIAIKNNTENTTLND